MVSQIDAVALAERISRPIDAARACYSLESVTIERSEQFLDVIGAFYVHLLRHRNSIAVSLDLEVVRADALALLERAFERTGG